jgi:GTP-binding protein HflX
LSDFYHPKKEQERCILVGVVQKHETRWQTEDHLFELGQLAYTAEATPIARVVQERQQIDPTYFIGKGKVKEIAEKAKMQQCNLVIFDDDLSPAQTRNLERMIQTKIVDRSGLILDIFARHARTREARTQVELAQLNYLLPRLTRQWTHLSRQVGGIGTRGPGETQLETDRRLIRTRIAALKTELEKIESQRSTQRKKRQNVFKAALVGYTNVGKSTLMKALTGADVLVQNQLFATLDATIRRLMLENGIEILLTDTVGFIRKLPHHLVASFKSTLEEIRDADLIIHVIDISSPNFRAHSATVLQIIREMGLQDIPILPVYNKIDKIKDEALINELREKQADPVFISASEGIQLKKMTTALTRFVEKHFRFRIYQFDQKDYHLLRFIHDSGYIIKQLYQENSVIVQVKLDQKMVGKLDSDNRIVRLDRIPENAHAG